VCGTHHNGTGYTIYSTAFLLVMVPHAIVTVSLATAILPRLSGYAADSDLRSLAASISSTLRTAYALIIPFAFLLPVVALDLSNLMIGYGAARPNVPDFAVSLALFAPGLVFFTAHYLMLRGFYALERTRTVFWVQCVIAATNIVAAVLLTRHASPAGTAPGLVIAYAVSYLVGAIGSFTLLRHVLGGLQVPVLVRFGVRLLIAVSIATGVAAATKYGVQQLWAAPAGAEATAAAGKLHAGILLALTGMVDLVVFLALSRTMRITEVTAVLGLLTRRLRR
jgi:putative peptidoglycan lipid II flippase